MSDFQPLRPWEYAALKADIKKRGVVVPIIVDEAGGIIDGRSRAHICDELGIVPPKIVRRYSSMEERALEHLALNVYRRQLTPARHREWVQAGNQLRLDLGLEPVMVPIAKPKEPSASDLPQAATARARDHRLAERLRPASPLPAGTDPWVVAALILDILDDLHAHALPGRNRAQVDRARELLKGLMWMEPVEEPVEV